MQKSFKIINTITNSLVGLYGFYISFLFFSAVIGHFTDDSGKETGNGIFFIILGIFFIGGAIINFIPNLFGFLKCKGKYLKVTFIISCVLLFLSIASWALIYLLLQK